MVMKFWCRFWLRAHSCCCCCSIKRALHKGATYSLFLLKYALVHFILWTLYDFDHTHTHTHQFRFSAGSEGVTTLYAVGRYTVFLLVINVARLLSMILVIWSSFSVNVMVRRNFRMGSVIKGKLTSFHKNSIH